MITMTKGQEVRAGKYVGFMLDLKSKIKDVTHEITRHDGKSKYEDARRQAAHFILLGEEVLSRLVDVKNMEFPKDFEMYPTTNKFKELVKIAESDTDDADTAKIFIEQVAVFGEALHKLYGRFYQELFLL